MSSLRVLVVRFDDEIITNMGMDTFMAKLTKRILEKLPEKRFGQDRRDEQVSAAIREGWLSLRSDLFSVGFKLATWADK